MTTLAVLMPATLITQAALAEKADRDKPVNLEADRIAVDDVNKVQTFEGNVQLIQGTLVIRSEKLVVTQDAAGYQKGVAFGGPGGLARFRQKREARDELMEGEAERIEHDAKEEKTQFFGRAWVRSGLDEVRGQYISYDAKTENYIVNSAPGAQRAATSPGERVRATIQPKNATPTPVSNEPRGAILLRPAPTITRPHQESSQ